MGTACEVRMDRHEEEIFLHWIFFSMFSSWGSRLCCLLEYASMIMINAEETGDDEADPWPA